MVSALDGFSCMAVYFWTYGINVEVSSDID
jgi:hypothetical protein